MTQRKGAREMRLSPGPPGMILRTIHRNWPTWGAALLRRLKTQRIRRLLPPPAPQEPFNAPQASSYSPDAALQNPRQSEASLACHKQPKNSLPPLFLLPQTCRGKSNRRNSICIENPRFKEVQKLEAFAVCLPQHRKAQQKDRIDTGVKLPIRFTYK